MDDKLKKIKSSVFSRGLSMAKISLSTGGQIAKFGINQLLSGEKQELLEKVLASQAALLKRELGEMKGSLMKAGQALSMYGEHFLPPEANQFLKSLQYQSPALEWSAIEALLIKELGKDKLALLEIQSEPLAAASLGQVHRARVKSSGEEIVLKVQYPGVDRAIDSDLKAIKAILKVLNLLPKELNTEPLFAEVKAMLIQEVNYSLEADFTEAYYQKNQLTANSKVIIPKVHRQFSSPKVLATDYLAGYFADSPEIQNLSQERRNHLAEIFLDHFFTEFLQWGLVQTDPHQGNFKIHLGRSLEEDKLIMLDFGATRKFTEDFRRDYAEFIRYSLYQQRAAFEKASLKIGFLMPNDPQSLKDIFYDFCVTTMEPYRENLPFDWGTTDLPDRLKLIAFKIFKGFPLRSPPQEVLFLDRKTGGVFIFLKILKAKTISRPIIERFIPK